MECPHCRAKLEILSAKVIKAPETSVPFRRSASGRFRLSPREAQCVDFVVEGMTSPEIAAKLQTTEQVIKNYLYHAFDKIGAANRADMVRIVLLGRE